MRRTQLLCAIGVSLWSAMAAGSQATDAGALSGALRAHVQDERFEIVTSIRGLPLGVRDGLQTLFGSRDTRHRRARSRVSGDRCGRQSEAADSSAGRGGVLDRSSLPRLLRARRYRPHVACGAVSLDAGRDSIRVGRYCAGGPGDNRRRSERDPLGRDQGPGQVLVVQSAGEGVGTSIYFRGSRHNARCT